MGKVKILYLLKRYKVFEWDFSIIMHKSSFCVGFGCSCLFKTTTTDSPVVSFHQKSF